MAYMLRDLNTLRLIAQNLNVLNEFFMATFTFGKDVHV